MDLNLIKESGKRISLQIEQEDFSIPDIIHIELLEDPDVVFAGIIKHHPLLKKYTISVETNNKVIPTKIVSASIERAIKKAKELLREIKGSLKGVKN